MAPCNGSFYKGAYCYVMVNFRMVQAIKNLMKNNSDLNKKLIFSHSLYNGYSSGFFYRWVRLSAYVIEYAIEHANQF
jgi:hypothetical protein